MVCMYRQAFEQAGKDPGCVFVKRGDIDLEKIKQSKYCRAIFQQSSQRTTDGVVSTPCHCCLKFVLLAKFHHRS